MNPKQTKLMEFIKASNNSLTKEEFNGSFAQVVRMCKLWMQQVDARITARLAQVKDGAPGPRGPKGDSIIGPPGPKGETVIGPQGPSVDENAIASRVIEEVIARALPELEKRLPALSNAVRDALELLPEAERPTISFIQGLEQHIKDTVMKHAYSMGGGAVVSIQQSGVQKVQQAAIMNFKGAGAPTVTVGNNGVTNLDFPGSSGTPVYNEVVSGSVKTYTLAHTPTSGTLRVYGRGQRLLPTTDYSLSSGTISTNDTWATGDLTADYSW